MKTIVYAAVSWFLLTGVSSAQQFSFGARGGLTYQNALGFGTRENLRWAAGPTIEVRWGKVTIGADLLYQRFGWGYLLQAQSGTGIQIQTGQGLVPLEGDLPEVHNWTRSHVLQLPVLAKYHFRSQGKWQPFLGTGYAFQMAWMNSKGTSYTIVGNRAEPFSFDSDSRSQLGIGAVAATGVRIPKGRLSVIPELRYTRWAGEGSPGSGKNQVQVMLGITF